MSELFEDIIQFPNPEADREYNSMVGLDEIKTRLIKESEIMINPGSLQEWSKKNHGKILPIAELFQHRHTLFVFSGDVGTGKTTLAETFGNYLANQEKIPITLYRLSLNARGAGAVGEMTKLISIAFAEIKTYAAKIKSIKGKYSSACILLIDEADALAQSRELDQMHHEDRAGVNALIRGVDSLTKAHLPVITVMCTNRLEALDPAVKRRAAAIFEFHRPNKEQRLHLFRKLLDGIGLKEKELEILVQLTGENEKRNFVYTYSDITQKILPSILLSSYPDKPIQLETIIAVIQNTEPTTPFKEYRKE